MLSVLRNADSIHHNTSKTLLVTGLGVLSVAGVRTERSY